MLATTVAPVFGTFPASAFAQNVGLVAITGIKSRYVVAVGGSVLFALGLFPVLGRLVAPCRCPSSAVRGGSSSSVRWPRAESGPVQGVVRRNLNLVIVAVASDSV